ncbi:MAG: sodium-translocating pyrophosphatase [Verrucomicrobia bacterium RIFCSPHIGHO2_12_FULL_41_10]|nr:MAG: sodium-translocating pyrophosphatase [Verrucomicrobia bacterium RIFCSPHIGHO2_12_FULL_41_10]
MFNPIQLFQNGIIFAIACGVLGIFVALILIRSVLKASSGTPKMITIAAAIQEGAKAYLNRQITAVALIAIIILGALLYFKGQALSAGFVIGASCSLAAGYVGMRVAVVANLRTAAGALLTRHAAMRMAFSGGAVTGLLVVGLALLSVGGFFAGARHLLGEAEAVNSLIGLALGASLISVFARLGGGIYTKAADVGADLVGKIEQNLEEDDPRNPATIADNVGDNVGDCAGMAADVFETYAVSLIGAILVGFLMMRSNPAAIIYPFVLGGISVIGSILGIFFVNSSKQKPGASLITAVVLSAIFSAVLFYPATKALFPTPVETEGITITAHGLYFSALIGLAMTAIIVLITNYFTSTQYEPVRRIARASETGHGTNIIAGIAVGNHATVLPAIFIIAAILGSFHLAGLYGVAVAVMSMLSLSGIIISLDAFGPITDNAGGIAVMSESPKSAREITDELDAVGNTMKAVTKGYAIASAGLAALVLFGSYVEELKVHMGSEAALSFSLSDPRVIAGLLIGGLLPFVFSAFSIDAVGKAAGAVVLEVRRQLQLHPGILTGHDTPEYGTCVDIVTKAALREMIIPALLPIATVIAVAFIPWLGPVALGGVLVGTIVTGLFLAISMTSSGGAWDNAKKYIEEGQHGGKGSAAHAAAVTGDTVGDPYKDTAGPAINPMIKVVNIVAILIVPLLFKK